MKHILSFLSPLWFKSESPPSHLLLTLEQRNQLEQELKNLKKENVELQQALREKTAQATAKNEDLFLELLEVVDALETLLGYLEKNPDPQPGFFQRLPKSLGAVHRKFLSVLGKRQVLPIELQEGMEPDFKLCRVVDREVRNDWREQRITKIIRRGFRLEEKILRSTEVITSKPD
ncbi:nucleotide exchange factor GrpE [Nodularia sphaerocarpa]|uniref:nucleotide exchange factor GrpE n=1 Tax=Nodularia sphaerocarpa TaxID=137816 RepID=UPI002FEE5B07|nr:Protein GrpE [Nodularia sphaerocarpa UHCC 0038]